MATRVIIQDRYPEGWAQIYALGYGELHSILCGVLGGELSRDEGLELIRRQALMQHKRVIKFTDKQLESFHSPGPRG